MLCFARAMAGDAFYGEVLKPLLHPREAATVSSGIWAVALGLFSGLAGVDADKILAPFVGAIAIGWTGHYFMVRHFVRQHHRLKAQREKLDGREASPKGQ